MIFYHGVCFASVSPVYNARKFTYDGSFNIGNYLGASAQTNLIFIKGAQRTKYFNFICSFWCKTSNVAGQYN